MMIKVKRLSLAEHVIIDMRTKKTSLINVIEDSTINRLPVHLRVEAYIVIEREIAKSEELLHFSVQTVVNGELKMTSEAKTTFGAGVPIVRHITVLGLIELTQKSLLTFNIIDDSGNILKSVDFDFHFAE